ncbi:MAG: hypothetical protein DRH08_00145 [Deltaproteobacteria bacterium]|nr:MAG: hypothetical protein DRH08_00145 [Deltaproteobacteria bacterium]
MSKSNTLENGWLDLFFLNAALANVGDASGLQPSGAPGSLYVSLHVGDPGEAGTQLTSEATYTSYARVAVARSGAGWSRSSNVIDNVAAITFPQSTGGSSTVDFFGIGQNAAGAGDLWYSGALTAALAISGGITPEFAIGALTVTED